jgi:hypothetical protein
MSARGIGGDIGSLPLDKSLPGYLPTYEFVYDIIQMNSFPRLMNPKPQMRISETK